MLRMIAVLFGISALGVSSALGAETIVTDFPQDGVVLGQGWNIFTGSPATQICVSGTNRDLPGLTTTLDFDQTTDKSSIMNRLTFSAEFKIKAVVGGGGGKLTYMSERTVKSEDLNILAHALVELGSHFIGPSGATASILAAGMEDRLSFTTDDLSSAISHSELFDDLGNDSTQLMLQLSAGALELKGDYATKSKDKPDLFRKECGQFFVSAIRDAGEIISVLTFSVDSREEKQKITAEANGAGAGWSANTAFSKTLEQYQEQRRLHIDYYKTGGKGAIPTEAEGLRTAISNLETWTAENAKPYKVVLTPYSALYNYKGGAIDDGTLVSADIASTYFQILAIYEYIKTVIKTPESYTLDWGTNYKNLLVLQDEMRTYLTDLIGEAKECDKTPRACKAPTTLRSDYDFRVALPVLKDSFIEDKNWRLDNAKLKKLNEQVAVTENRCKSMGNGLGRAICLQQLRELKGALNGVQKRYDRYTAEYPAALKRYKEAELIRSVSNERCEFGLESLGCLSNKQVEDYVAKIPVNANP